MMRAGGKGEAGGGALPSSEAEQGRTDREHGSSSQWPLQGSSARRRRGRRGASAGEGASQSDTDDDGLKGRQTNLC